MLPQKNNNCDNKKASVYMTDAQFEDKRHLEHKL